MQLGALLEGVRVKEARGEMRTEIKGLGYDSRTLREGCLFAALKGGRMDGQGFIGEAVRKGAVAVLSEGPQEAGASVPYVLVDNAREALARVSSNFHGRPSERLAVVGVTGTNGKTTTAYLIKSVLEAAGHKVGLIGTINYMIGEKTFPAPYTTPEAPEFQGLLREMLDAGCTHVVTEVSSHALAHRRVDYTEFRAGVFTNLTPEHLDFHHDMEEYFTAKKRFFKELLSGPAVINADDPYGRRLGLSLKGGVLTYSIESGADLRAMDVENTLRGIAFMLETGGGRHRVESRLIGLCNVYNILAAVGALLAIGVPWDSILRGVLKLRQVEGRFQRLDMGQDFLCIIDYAHTEDALRRLILTARELTAGRVITVFGCGGDRDRSKRPVMGRAATSLSDLVLITSDNPRGEDPLEIIREIESGAAGDNHSAVPDRREAIIQAVREAQAGDTVLIAGKGHEEYQEMEGRRSRFSDREAAEEAIKTFVIAPGGA